MRNCDFSFINKSKVLTLLSSAGILMASSANAHTPLKLPQVERSSALLSTVAENDQKAEQAVAFIQSLVDEGISFLTSTNLDEAKRKEAFEKLLSTKFDLKTIARFSLGKYWRQTPEKQKNEYIKLFESMIIDVYSNRFSDYDGQELNVKDARPEGKYDYIVHSMLIPAEGPQIRVDWRVRTKNGQTKVIDIIVEGVSMALTQRSDFASVIQRGGGDVSVLLEHLRNR